MNPFGALAQDLQAGNRAFGYDPSIGGMQTSQLAELRKSLDAGYTLSGMTGGGSLRLQSLEAQVVATAESARQFVFCRFMDRSQATSTVEEWTVQSDYGTDDGGFVRENDTPATQSQTLARQYGRTKYLANTREVSHVMATVHAQADAMASETRAGILWSLRRLENTIDIGDRQLAYNSAEGEEFDGLRKTCDSTVFIDNEGLPPQYQVFRQAVATARGTGNASPDAVIMSLECHRDLESYMFSQGRFGFGGNTNEAGLGLEQLKTGMDKLNIFPSKFLKTTRSPQAAATSSLAPTAAATVALATGGTDGNFAKGAIAGDGDYYVYAVCLANRYGQSAPTFSTALQITAANRVTGVHIALTITNPAAVGSYVPEFAWIYRTRVRTTNAATTAVADFSYIGRVPVSSQANNGTTITNDVNLFMPFTSVAYVLQWDPEVFTMRELFPMFRLDLGISALTLRWIVGWYGLPIQFAPKKIIPIINIGEA